MISRRSVLVARRGTGIVPDRPREESDVDDLARRVAALVEMGTWTQEEAKFRHEIASRFPVSPAGFPTGGRVFNNSCGVENRGLDGDRAEAPGGHSLDS